MRLQEIDKAKKKDLMVNKLMDGKDRALEYAVEGKRCIEPRKDTSPHRCSNSISLRLQQKFRFQVEGGEKPRTTQMVRLFN